LTKTEFRFADPSLEQDCDIPVKSRKVEDQLDGLQENLKCERAKNAGQRAYRAEMTKDK